MSKLKLSSILITQLKNNNMNNNNNKKTVKKLLNQKIQNYKIINGIKYKVFLTNTER